MGVITRILSFVRKVQGGANVADVKMDLGQNATITGEHYSSPGDDSAPLPGDYAAAITHTVVGSHVPVGYLDPINAGIAQPGEKRIYSRDSSGVVQTSIYLRGDGTWNVDNAGYTVKATDDGAIQIQNANVTMEITNTGGFKASNVTGFLELLPSGTVSINGFTFAPGLTGSSTGGSISVDSLIVNGKELDGHTHSGVTTGGSNTGPNN
jgi:hypothetical protein